MDFARHNCAVENINQWIGEGFEFFSKLVYLSKSMGHGSLDSTRIYLDVTIEQKTKALATLEDENSRKSPKKWKDNKSSPGFAITA